MKRLLFIIVFCVSLTLGANVQAGVEPSPFKSPLVRKANVIVERIEPLLTMEDLPLEVTVQLREVFDVMSNIEVLDLSKDQKKITMQTISLLDDLSIVMLTLQPDPLGGEFLVQTSSIMDRITAVAFNPQPEPPIDVISALSILKNISQYVFSPQLEPPGTALLGQTLSTMDMISAVAFDPQPEPPGKVLDILKGISTNMFDPQAEPQSNEIRKARMEIFERITKVGFDPQPEPPGKVLQVLDVFGSLSAVMFDPQPEPPGRDLVEEMLEIIDMMAEAGMSSAH